MTNSEAIAELKETLKYPFARLSPECMKLAIKVLEDQEKMSISREESIKIISLFRDEWAKNSKCPNAHALDKAISDMEKLEKIEQIVKCVDENCKKSKDECFDCMYEKLNDIEQIVNCNK